MIRVFMMVATITFTGSPPARVVPLEQPFFRTMQECARLLESMPPQRIPNTVMEIKCEPHWLDPRTGVVLP